MPRKTNKPIEENKKLQIGDIVYYASCSHCMFDYFSSDSIRKYMIISIDYYSCEMRAACLDSDAFFTAFTYDNELVQTYNDAEFFCFSRDFDTVYKNMCNKILSTFEEELSVKEKQLEEFKQKIQKFKENNRGNI